MEDPEIASALLVKKCEACNATVMANDTYCLNCGYPLKGSSLEQKAFIAKRDNVSAINNRLHSAANALYYLAGVFVFSGLVTLTLRKKDPDVLSLVMPMLILAILFLILGALCKKAPLACTLVGFCVFIAVQVFNFFNNPAALAYGIIIKVIVLAYLIKSIKSAFDLEKIKKQAG
jgi:hypothetical protein